MSKSGRKRGAPELRRRTVGRSPLLWIAVVAAGGVVAYAAIAMRHKETPTPASASTSAAMPVAMAFAETVPNTSASTTPSPEGMVWIPGGEFSMGAQDPTDVNDSVGMQATGDSRPVHRVYVDGFWMGQTEVTNAQFAAFVKATRYVTVAERTPRAEDFPGAPP